MVNIALVKGLQKLSIVVNTTHPDPYDWLLDVRQTTEVLHGYFKVDHSLFTIRWQMTYVLFSAEGGTSILKLE